MKSISFIAVLGVIATLALPLPARGGPGHEHGSEHTAPAATGSASPRFAAYSELFELVGVLEGRRLTLYLDRSADNAPVLGAKIELEIAGSKFIAQKHSAQEDAYEVVLAADPKAETLPVTATVTAGQEIDLLASELDLNEDPHANEAAHVHSWQEYVGWAAASLAVLFVLLLIGRRLAVSRQSRAGATA